MFERRLKIVLFLLAGVVGLLMLRAAQVQIVHRHYWQAQAVDALKHTHLVDTTRGNIYDRNGKLLATDTPCIDACVDYRALTTPPDPAWVKEQALARLRSRYSDGWSRLPSKQKVALREQESAAVEADIRNMWGKLAEVSARSLDEIEKTRDAIVRRVRMRQRYVWYKRAEAVGASASGGNFDWKKWIADGGDDPTSFDSVKVTVAEELEPHAILRAVDTTIQNELGKDIEHYPGLVLRPGTHRSYPYADVACHLIGHIGRVSSDDLRANKKVNELRNYLPNDLIGKAGVEALCESTLRGTRGKIDRSMGDETVLASLEPRAGEDVRVTIDIDLQAQIQAAFAAATLRDGRGNVVEENALLHGAAVVLDVQSNQALALVSYPTYDLNALDELYPQLRDDDVNDPLQNRATMSQLEPGSTMKPFCGLVALTAGVVGINEGIECTGRLKLDGRYVPGGGRCWVSSKFGAMLKAAGMSDAHHPVPSDAPHVGHDGNPDGFLTYSDALERSCNIYFETVADRLGIDRLSAGYERFGFGRATGIGIGEAHGRLPRNCPVRNPAIRRTIGFFGGIGQGYLAATPIQMANGAAMIARDGVWMRPILVLPPTQGELPLPAPGPSTPDKVDLALPPAALKAAKLGMFNVVNAKAGTGKAVAAGDKLLLEEDLCGKTGTAQAARFSIPARDAQGRVLYDERHHVIRRFLEPSTPGHPNPLAPWYRTNDAEGKDLNHAWYIGFAPADHPKIAFAVMVEYGGSGGVAAASVARQALLACIARGYLPPPSHGQPTTAPSVVLDTR